MTKKMLRQVDEAIESICQKIIAEDFAEEENYSATIEALAKLLEMRMKWVG